MNIELTLSGQPHHLVIYAMARRSDTECLLCTCPSMLPFLLILHAFTVSLQGI